MVKFSKEALIGIVLGICGGLVLAVILEWWFERKMKKNV
jgi:hypothetical protein